MAMVEKDLADAIVDLRQQVALGHSHCRIDDVIAAHEAHLGREQWWRAQMAQQVPS